VWKFNNSNSYRPRYSYWTLFLLTATVTIVSSCRDAEGEAPARAEAIATQVMEPGRQPPAGHAWVIFGNDTVVAEVAATAEERSQGLMYRDEVPDGTGMLFVFTDNQVRSFWMANTYVALDIGYMDPSYAIVDIVPMEPLVTDSYSSAAPAMFGLEVRQGWFQEHSIRIGDKADIVFGIRSAR